MASISTPRIMTYLADGVIAKGKAVKIGSDNQHVVVGSANTDKCIGIYQGETTTAAGSVAEAAIIGGGAKALLGEGVSAGAYLVSHTDGTLVKANAAGDHVCAIAMEDGSTSDIIAVEVVAFEAYNAE